MKRFAEAIRPADWDHARLLELVELIRDRRVLVIGDVGVDRYTTGLVERISPEAPVPIVLVQDETLKLGLAANVADNIRALGGEPWMVGVVGADPSARDLRSLMKRGRISDSHLIIDRGRRTVVKQRVVSERQQLLRIDFESQHRVDDRTESQLLRKIRSLLPRSDAVIVEDYAKGMLSEKFLARVFKLARGARLIAAVDPNIRTAAAAYRGATLLTPNTREAEALAGHRISDERSLLDAGDAILKTTGVRHVVITRGKEGMALFTAGERRVHLIPTYAREVYDVSGAGDTVISVLTLALAARASLVEAAILANLAAGVEVGKRGTATVSSQEITLALEFFGKARADSVRQRGMMSV